MFAYTKPIQWKKEECERLRGERYKIRFIDPRFGTGRSQDVSYIAGHPLFWYPSSVSTGAVCIPTLAFSSTFEQW